MASMMVAPRCGADPHAGPPAAPMREFRQFRFSPVGGGGGGGGPGGAPPAADWLAGDGFAADARTEGERAADREVAALDGGTPRVNLVRPRINS